MEFNLLEIFRVKDKILESILRDDRLTKTLFHPQPNSLALEAPRPSELLYKHVFPFKKNAESLVTTKKNFLTMDYSVGELINNNFKPMAINLYIIVHEDNMPIMVEGNLMLRTDYIAHRLDVLFNQARDFGIGPMKTLGLRPLELPSNDFQGLVYTISTLNFN